MSHTHKDQPGGHVKTIVEIDGWLEYSTPRSARFAKKFTRREARREAKRITRAAIADAADETEWLIRCREECEAELSSMYDMLEPYEEEDDDAQHDILNDYYNPFPYEYDLDY